MLGLATALVVAALAANDVDATRKTALVETVDVETYYLCDGYASFGDASFYDCAQRFFREGSKPNRVEDLTGQWLCRSAVNGPTAQHEQTIKLGHYTKGKPGKKGSTDALLVQRIFEDNPKPRRMHRDHLSSPRIVGRFMLNALVGAVDRGETDWVSTNWAYVEETTVIRFFGSDAPRFYDTRAAMRVYEGSLLIEHVATAQTRAKLWKVLSEDPRSVDAREQVDKTLASGEAPKVISAIRLIDELINDKRVDRGGDAGRRLLTQRGRFERLEFSDHLLRMQEVLGRE